MIIATDMRHHFENLETFRSNTEVSNKLCDWPSSTPALKVLLHSAGMQAPPISRLPCVGTSIRVGDAVPLPPEGPSSVSRCTPYDDVALEQPRSKGFPVFRSYFKELSHLPDVASLSSSLACASPPPVAIVSRADISNPGRPLHWAVKWAELLAEEFYQQGDEERRLGQAVSPLGDRANTNLLPKSQLGFVEAIVLPTFSSLQGIIKSALPVPVKLNQYGAETLHEEF